MELIHLALRSEYSFKKVFGHLKIVIDDYAVDNMIGFADEGNTYSFSEIERYANENGHSPIYAVRFTVCKDATERVPPRGQFGREYILIAKNKKGISELYALTKINYDNFYYRGNISYWDINDLSDNVIVISKDPIKKLRCDYLAISQNTPMRALKMAGNGKYKPVAIVENYFPAPEDKDVYQVFTGPRETDNKTFPQHIMSTTEFITFMSDKTNKKTINEAIKNTKIIAKKCSKTKLPKASMVEYTGNETVGFLCKMGAKKLGIDLKNGKYKKRYEYELGLIERLGFQDYFLIVAKIVRSAKKKMLVGPGRGSSGGSLICFLLGITELDPIKHKLTFERFIDINRDDLPDIDIDFPDQKRDVVVRDIVKEYGEENVSHIATISRMKPDVSINEWAKGLRIPSGDLDSLKNSIITIQGGDTRKGTSIESAINDNEVAREFFEQWPNMASMSKIEDHSRHFGVHAAGIIVCNDPVIKYSGYNSRDGCSMCEKKGAEYLNLLKIDILGLRTLSVLEDCCNAVGFDYNKLYRLELNDKKTFKIFNKMRLEGVFQFEGYSLASLTRKMKIECFEDIVAITALARPGALYSGGAQRYIQYKNGEEEIVYVGKEHASITKETFGTVVYQEQVMRICREIGGMDWEGVNQIRKCVSNKYGKAFLDKFRKDFDKGATERGYDKEKCDFLWGEIEGSGSYAFNRSHAVAYAMLSYWCAYLKSRYPKEFTVANLNHAKSVDSAIKILRDAVVTEKFEYVSIDPDESEKKWSINSKGVIVGGLLNVHGIGPAAANKIIQARENGEKLAPAIIKKLLDPNTGYDILFPTQYYWGDFFENPNRYGLTAPPSEIVEVQEKGSYLFVGKLLRKNIRDLNEYVNLQRRGGKVLEKDSLSLAITVQDDTDSIMCNVNRFRYEEMGREVAETGIEDKDWYLIRGEIKHEGRYPDISAIMKLDRSMMEA